MRVKMSKPPPPAPTASAIGPCPTVIKTVGRSGTGSLPSTIAPPDHPLEIYIENIVEKGRNCSPGAIFLLFSTIFCNQILDSCVKTRTRFSLRDNRLFEITEVEITRVDCMSLLSCVCRYLIYTIEHCCNKFFDQMRGCAQAWLVVLGLTAL